MNYADYKESRNLTWKILVEQRCTELPIKVSKICSDKEIALFSYKKAIKMIEKLELQHKTINNDGFAIKLLGKQTLFYNDQCTIGRQRFTVAHELGHLLLGHVMESCNGVLITTVNREPDSNDNPIEQAANVFASRLLAPACVLWGLNVKTAKEIMQFCDISLQSAEFRMERLNELYEREKTFLKIYGKSCFFLSPLERQVHKQFKDYIERNKL